MVDLGRGGVDVTYCGASVASFEWDHMKLGGNKVTLDGDLDFLSSIGADTNLAVSVTNTSEGLESDFLNGLSMLLDG